MKRRDFLKLTMAVGAAMLVPVVAPAEPEPHTFGKMDYGQILISYDHGLTWFPLTEPLVFSEPSRQWMMYDPDFSLHVG